MRYNIQNAVDSFFNNIELNDKICKWLLRVVYVYVAIMIIRTIFY